MRRRRDGERRLRRGNAAARTPRSDDDVHRRAGIERRQLFDVPVNIPASAAGTAATFVRHTSREEISIVLHDDELRTLWVTRVLCTVPEPC